MVRFSSKSAVEIPILLLDIIQDHPTITAGGLISYFENEPERALLGELAAQEPLIPTNAWQSQFIGSLQRTAESTTEYAIDYLMQKAAKIGLNEEEKQELKTLLSRAEPENQL